MRQLCISVALLLGMLALLGWNSYRMTSWMNPLEDRLAESLEAVEKGDWKRGTELEDSVRREWKKNRTYLHLIQCHAGVDEVSALLEQGDLFLNRQEPLQYASVCLRALGEMGELKELEHLSVGTLF